ncbi:hypothetical protein [Rhodococcus sp. T7]|uniref:hypothetical protein n=1 Tax=Rhodococcus sp. T7 TaxID=627444 RepID=UPI00135CB3D7|nr:hypothetical protein [Rhodococcus sp. T7]KAF0957743.1 hypothetical protein MLGJGCBP_09575 [Rhodococcus sp. T7]KAF0959909.1 hypothetical protein MLGJGCBP_06944 [Rhodococcus sp. T7]
MENRRERRARKSAGSNSVGKYYPPSRDLEYDEYVGELGPARNGIHTEMHVRYGVLNDQYLDWSVTLYARRGDLDEILRTQKQLERRKIESVAITSTAIQRQTFDVDNPDAPPTTVNLVALRAGSEHTVDTQFDETLKALSHKWANKCNVLGPGVAHPRTVATFAFAQNNRDPEFRNGIYSWVRNTIIAHDSDTAEEVLVERGGYYFPRQPISAAVRVGERMKFLKAKRPVRKIASEDHPIIATTGTTMGMIVEAVNSGDWTDEIGQFLDD